MKGIEAGRGTPPANLVVVVARWSTLLGTTILTLASLFSFVPVAAAGPQPAPGDRVLVLHDSVVNGARQQIIDAFPNRTVEFVGFGGLRVSGAVELLEARPDLITSDVIVELGLNYGNSKKQFRNDLNKLMALLKDAQHVLWLQPTQFREGISEPRTIIRNAARRYPNLHVVDWGTEAARNPHYTRDDGIHLQGDGPHALARFMNQHLTGVIPWNRIPEGTLGSVRVNKQDIRAGEEAPRVRLKGWAYDPDITEDALVRIMVDGRLIRAAQPTNVFRGSLAKSLDHGNTKIGFSRLIRLKSGRYRLCIEVDNQDGSAPIELSCKTVRV